MYYVYVADVTRPVWRTARRVVVKISFNRHKTTKTLNTKIVSGEKIFR